MLIYSVQEKYGSDVRAGDLRRVGSNQDGDRGTGSSTNSDTDSEEEDDEGVLASEALDRQIQDTLEAIRRKDPRVYDESAKFFTDIGDEAQDSKDFQEKPEKPMYLNDYHRRNLLEGPTSTEDGDEATTSYAQQQNDLKHVIVK